MFLRPTEPRSIASELVLLFTLAATCLLSCLLGVFYLIVVRHAFEEDNVFLADKISALQSELKKADWPKSLNEELRAIRAGEHSAYWIRVVSATGDTLAETPGMTALLPSKIFPTAEAAKTSLFKPTDYRTGGKLFSLVATPGQASDQPYMLQLAQDRSSDEQFTKEFRTLLLGGFACGILASAIIAVTVTRRGLRPLAEMTQSLRLIGPTHLNERVAPGQWPRELQPLAGAFDEMLDRLEDSFTRLSQFSADLAHELRTPVANILGEAQVALTRARTPDEYREIIESNAAECQRLSGIIDNLLFLARAEAAREHINRTQIDGRVAVEKIISFYETIAEEQQIVLTCTGKGNIYADSVLFGRAVSNLVENALRFTPAGGTVAISITTSPAQSEISVRDSGSGIAPLHIPRVFDRFYRADPSRSSLGAGLGLSLVRSITALHGGSARLESEVGQGTTVTLLFPNSPDRPENSSPNART